MHIFTLQNYFIFNWFVWQKKSKHKKDIKPAKLKNKTFMFTLCCTSSGIFNIEDGFPWMICLTNDRREKKRIINYFCELLHGRDNKPAWSPWIWHICSENNTIISKGERSGENMRTPGLKCQWSIPVLISIPENNNKDSGKQTVQTFRTTPKKQQWTFAKACVN